MPRCTDGKWCVDDLCYWSSRTLCGLDLDYDRAEDGDYLAPEDDPELWEPDDADGVIAFRVSAWQQLHGEAM